MKLLHLNILALTLIATLALGSCNADSENSDPKAPASVGFSISSRAAQTAAPEENELIHTWFIAFVDASGKVARTLERPDGKLPVEREEFTTTLAPGNYTVYSFANISPADLGLSFAEGSQVPADIAAVPCSAPDVNDWTKDKLIPMTGLQNVNVTTHVTQPFAVEVVRLVAKMEFQFSNATEYPIEINALELRPMGAGKINLFPDYNSLGKEPALRPEAKTGTIERILGDRLAPNTDKGISHSFYTLESNAGIAHPTGHYVISLNLTRLKDGSGSPETISVLTPELTYINRNDYILIPIRLADYHLEMDVRFYPPIGGYPAVVTENKGSDYYIRFGTQGAFSITPLMREGSQGAPWLQPSQMNIAIEEISDPSGIFTQEPAYNAATGEITGELANTTGTATVTLQISPKDSNLSYNRTVYIIREDKK